MTEQKQKRKERKDTTRAGSHSFHLSDQIACFVFPSFPPPLFFPFFFSSFFLCECHLDFLFLCFFVRSFVRSFVRLFVCLFVCLFLSFFLSFHLKFITHNQKGNCKQERCKNNKIKPIAKIKMEKGRK